MEFSVTSPAAVVEAFRLGYGTVVLDHRITMPNYKSRLDEALATPVAAAQPRIASRATILLEAPPLDVPRALAQSFDIIAVEASTEAAFARACACKDVDLVSVDCRRRSFALARAPIVEAVARGACFEVCYGPAIEDITTLRHLAATAARLNDACRGKRLLLSSGVGDPALLRPPPDVANLAKMLGIHANLTDAACAVFAHADKRLGRPAKSWLDPQLLRAAVPLLFKTAAPPVTPDQAPTVQGPTTEEVDQAPTVPGPPPLTKEAEEEESNNGVVNNNPTRTEDGEAVLEVETTMGRRKTKAQLRRVAAAKRRRLLGVARSWPLGTN